MIDSNELMIGNYILEDTVDLENGGRKKDLILVNANTIACAEQRTNKYEPIPLTPEILRKVDGIKHVVVDIYKIPLSITNTLFIQLEFRAKDVVVGIKNEAGYITVNSFRNYSIHRLQNLYYLLTQQHLIIQL